MTEIMKGKPAAEEIKNDITERVEKLKEKSITTILKVIRLGENQDDISYEKSIIKNCDELGIEVQVEEVDEDIDTDGLLEILKEANNDDTVNGILVFRPLPDQIDEEAIMKAVDPGKDVDCMNPVNLEKVFEGDFSGNVPATPAAAIRILDFYDVDLEGKNVAIINRSLVFGRPFAMMALGKNATPTICHSRTQNIEEITKNADVVVTAQGRANALGKEYFTEDSIVVDVGMSMGEDNKITGDLDFDALDGFVKMMTPTPGGVGSMTTSILLEQVVASCERMNG